MKKRVDIGYGQHGKPGGQGKGLSKITSPAKTGCPSISNSVTTTNVMTVPQANIFALRLYGITKEPQQKYHRPKDQGKSDSVEKTDDWIK